MAEYFLPLSPYRIGTSVVLQTLVWAYLWFGPGKFMQTRHWQCWWQLGGYTILWIMGLRSMLAEDLMDIHSRIQDIWTISPHITVISRAYFETEIAWYGSQLLTLIVQRDLKDYYAMLLHHLITPVEIYFSYHCGVGPTGLFIMFLHDTSDICLHVAKSLHIASYKRLTDIAFVFFAVVFFITRLVILPQLPYSYFFAPGNHRTSCRAALAYTCFVLVLLHAYWFYLIIRMIKRFASSGKVEGDIREPEVEAKQKQNKNQPLPHPESPLVRSIPRTPVIKNEGNSKSARELPNFEKLD
eukprot:TRINITY_DN1512_c0_g1_i1.p1 TRINITY_DN1512_c0_g1~~TRINITY_DN1512_c0_g1_i1.p1  ORF type:complete len:298 (+),score=48.21 TRINITY_DN1512_c0_g1_i1:198-1091(+)